jgi:two-component SAPR family response regulator
LPQAIEIYEEALNIAREVGDQSQISWVLDGLGHAHRLANNLDRALSLFEQARHLAEREGIGSQVMLSSASIGIASVEQGNLSDGIARLERACDALRDANAYLDLGRALYWLSRAHFESRQTSLAKDRLIEMSRLGHRLGCRPFSLADGRRAIALLDWGAAQFPSDTWLRSWLETLRVDTDAAHLEVVEARPATVRVEAQAFGPGRVSRDGRMLTISEWGGSAIARELLFYLLDRSPQRKEEIGAVFWPNLSLPRMTSAFHAAKYKMHRALGVEIVIYEDEQYKIDPSSGLWCDMVEFRHRLDTARRLAPDDPERLNELEQAVMLYTGDFLTDIYSEWAEDSRRTLRSRYMDALCRLVDLLQPRRQFERVLELCQRGLEFDYFREDLHRAIMSALAETGRLAQALAHYGALTQRLTQEFQAEPEPETIELADHIRSRRLG